MALIDAEVRVLEDNWIYGSEDIAANVIVPFAVLAENATTPRPVGVRVGPDVGADKVAALLDRVDLVAIEFPKFRDGRGFTTARVLREKYGYKGEIRAVGHVIPDQFEFLIQCGFSTVLTPPEHPPEHFRPVVPAGGGEGTNKKPLQLLNRLVGHRGAV